MDVLSVDAKSVEELSINPSYLVLLPAVGFQNENAT